MIPAKLEYPHVPEYNDDAGAAGRHMAAGYCIFLIGMQDEINLHTQKKTRENHSGGLQIMKTDKLWVNGSIRRNSEVNEILRDFADEAGITGKDFQHMNLLAEETLGMANQLLKDFDGEIWLETTPAGYEIILEADVRENREEAPCAPDAPEGFMAKIAEMLNCSYMFEDISEMPENLAATLPDYLSYGLRDSGGTPAWAGIWSLSAYRNRLEGDPDSGINLDELEKSIVASLADEVAIGIHGRRVRLVISKS